MCFIYPRQMKKIRAVGAIEDSAAGYVKSAGSSSSMLSRGKRDRQ